MNRIGLKIIASLLTGLACSGTAFCSETIEVKALPVEEGPPAPAKNDSFTRGFMWDSSFDKAGDATQEAQKALSKPINVDCTSDTLKPEQKAACEEIKAKSGGFAKEAESIQKMQYIFADVSRASDVAALGAIGATGYAELGKKNPNQSDSLNSVARIQETAGMVSYTTGAADFSMGAYAYLAQKRKLEQMKEMLNGTRSGVRMSTDNDVVNKLNAAAEETKKAAYNHMMYGAGKVAVGYASMYLAKQNRKQAERLSSIPMPVPGSPAYNYANSNNGSGGGVPYYQNNNPQFLTGGQSNTPSDTSPSGVVTIPASSGGSALPSPEFRGLANTGNKGQGVSAGGIAGLGAAKGGSSEGPAEEGEIEAAAGDAATKEAMGDSFEISLTGGGGSRYGGGGKSSEESSDGVASLFGNMLGGAATGSSATGVNPNSIYKDALAGLDGDEQGAMAGVNGKDTSLFQVVKAKYTKMMEGGRLQRPGAVEVRN